MTDRDTQADAIERLGRAIYSSVDFEFDVIRFSCDISEPDVQKIRISASKSDAKHDVDLGDDVYEALDELEDAFRESQKEAPKVISGSIARDGKIEVDLTY